MTYFLVIDLGATYIKCAKVAFEKKELFSVVRLPFPGFELNNDPRKKTVSLKKILNRVVKLIKTQLENNDDCIGISFANQMHGLVVFDGSKNPYSPFISWQDTSCFEVYENNQTYFNCLKYQLSGFDWLSETGEQVRVGMPVSQLYKMQKLGNLKHGSIPIDLGNAIAFLLGDKTGEIKVDPTNSSASCLFDIHKFKWHSNLIKEIGIDQITMPQIVGYDEIVGYFKNGKKNIPIYVSVGDQQCSLLGVGFKDLSLISANVATGSQISCLTKNITTTGKHQIRPYFFDYYLKTVTHIPAGRGLNALVNLFLEFDPRLDFDSVWRRLVQISSMGEEKSLDVSLSFFASAFADEGYIRNINEGNFNIGNLMRSSFSSIAKSHRKAFDLFGVSTDEFKSILCSGGLLTKNKFLQDCFEMEFGLPLLKGEHQEDSLIGLLNLRTNYFHK